ncbi:hypothetical protein WM23_25650 [Burkholderia ubonensis]|nr:hypothetical protein WM23_25650 [Burkholderia ubonensis]
MRGLLMMTPLTLQFPKDFFEIRIVGESSAEVPVVCETADQVIGQLAREPAIPVPCEARPEQ